jgi:succinate dehydrogenase/fumarate reductase flavoprotein subunit
MANLDTNSEVHSADVLILGAGLAGYIVANRVKELNPELSVLLVEKSTAGWSGSKANKGAGVMWVMEEKDDVGKFRDYYSAPTATGWMTRSSSRRSAAPRWRWSATSSAGG